MVVVLGAVVVDKTGVEDVTMHVAAQLKVFVHAGKVQLLKGLPPSEHWVNDQLGANTEIDVNKLSPRDNLFNSVRFANPLGIEPSNKFEFKTSACNFTKELIDKGIGPVNLLRERSKPVSFMLLKISGRGPDNWLPLISSNIKLDKLEKEAGIDPVNKLS